MKYLNHNFIHAYRNLKKRTGYTLLTIAGLTIGISVFLLIALFVHKELTVDHNINNHERIIRLYDEGIMECDVDYELAQVIRDNFPNVQANVTLERAEWKVNLKSRSNHVQAKAWISTTNNFFKVFDFKILSKIAEEPFPESKAIILTESTAKRLFGLDNALGKTVNVDNMFDLKVTAIVADFPENTSIQSDFLVNAEDEDLRMSHACNNGDCFYPMEQIVMLNKGVDAEDFMLGFNESIHNYQKRVSSFGFEYLDDIYLNKAIERSGFKHGNRSFLKILSLIGLVILLLSIINYINFSLSVQQAKIREVSIKKINGAGFRQLFSYYMVESWQMLSVVSLLSLLLVFAFSPSVSHLLSTSLDPRQLFNPAIMVALFVVFIVIVLLNSIIPLYAILRLNIVDGISNKSLQNRKVNVKPLLTTVQFVASIVLLIGVLTVLKQLKYVDEFDMGFDKELLLGVSLPWEYEHGGALKQEVSRLDFVQSVSLSSGKPGQITLMMGSDDRKNEFMIDCIRADSNFLSTMDMQIVQGRSFFASEVDNACVMNEAAYEKYEWESIEGKRYMKNDDGGYAVVGVVKNFNVSSLHQKAGPVCVLFSSHQPNTLNVRLSKGDVKNHIAHLKEVWFSVNPGEPFSFQFYDTFFENLYKKEQQLARSIIWLALIAILLTVMGILGQVLQLCIDKTKEIGIRKVNGATDLEIVEMLNQEFVKWVLLAFALACPISYFVMNKWLQSFAYKTELSWWVFALAGIVALTIALLTVSFQTIRAARKNPVDALRYE